MIMMCVSKNFYKIKIRIKFVIVNNIFWKNIECYLLKFLTNNKIFLLILLY